MVITPTATGMVLSGGGYWSLLWSFLFKSDHIPVVNKIIKKDRILSWMTSHKAETLIVTEAINLGGHSGPAGIPFALGGTMVNITMVFIILPLRAIFQRRKAKHGKVILAV